MHPGVKLNCICPTPAALSPYEQRDALPLPNQSQTKSFTQLVKKLFPHGIEYVKQQPTAACSLVGMCGGHAGTGSGAMQEAEASMKQPLVGTRGVADASPCDQCKMTVLEIRMVINNPTMQSEITNVTRSLCDRVPPYEVGK